MYALGVEIAPPPVALPPLSLLPSSPTTMAVRCASKCIASVSADTLDAWERWSAQLDQWMAHPGFDWAEYSRLCRHYGLD